MPKKSFKKLYSEKNQTSNIYYEENILCIYVHQTKLLWINYNWVSFDCPHENTHKLKTQAALIHEPSIG